jgi:hypothetical protein
MRVRHGIYAPREFVQAAADDPRLAHALTAAAELGARVGRAAASHETAAWLHELTMLGPRPTTVSLTVGRETWRGRAGVDFRTGALPPRHIVRLLGVPVTSAARTVIDLARERPFTNAVVVADSALHLGAADRANLREVLDDCRQWPGIRPALDVVEFADPRAESVLESLARVLCQAHRLPRPDLQASETPSTGRNAAGRLDLCMEIAMITSVLPVLSDDFHTQVCSRRVVRELTATWAADARLLATARPAAELEPVARRIRGEMQAAGQEEGGAGGSGGVRDRSGCRGSRTEQGPDQPGDQGLDEQNHCFSDDGSEKV